MFVLVGCALYFAFIFCLGFMINIIGERNNFVVRLKLLHFCNKLVSEGVWGFEKIVLSYGRKIWSFAKLNGTNYRV